MLKLKGYSNFNQVKSLANVLKLISSFETKKKGKQQYKSKVEGEVYNE